MNDGQARPILRFIRKLKILTGKERVESSVVFLISPTVDLLRGHDMKLFQSRSRLQLRENFFSQRVVTQWNSPPRYVVEAPSVNCFKSKLDRHWKQKDMNV